MPPTTCLDQLSPICDSNARPPYICDSVASSRKTGNAVYTGKECCRGWMAQVGSGVALDIITEVPCAHVRPFRCRTAHATSAHRRTRASAFTAAA